MISRSYPHGITGYSETLARLGKSGAYLKQLSFRYSTMPKVKSGSIAGFSGYSSDDHLGFLAFPISLLHLLGYLGMRLTASLRIFCYFLFGYGRGLPFFNAFRSDFMGTELNESRTIEKHRIHVNRRKNRDAKP